MYLDLDHKSCFIRFRQCLRKGCIVFNISIIYTHILKGHYYSADNSFELKQNIKLRSKFFPLISFQYLNPICTGLFGWCSIGGGGCFPALPNSFVFKVTLLTFYTELHWSKMNIVQQKNLDQIDNDMIMTSSLLCWVLKLAKNCLFLYSYCFSISYQILLKLGKNIWLTHFEKLGFNIIDFYLVLMTSLTGFWLFWQIRSHISTIFQIFWFSDSDYENVCYIYNTDQK